MKHLDPYQDRGADWLASGASVLYLADQMRVGKTAQCVSACDRLGAKRVLVLCPAIARGGWKSEFAEFASDPGYAASAVMVYSAKDIEAVNDATRLIVVSYDLALQRDVWSMLFSRGIVYGFDVLILDEAHYLIHQDAQRTQLVLGERCDGKNALAGLAKRVWFVSGTPERNSPVDLFPFCRLAGLWNKPRYDFINKFCYGYKNGFEFKITGGKNLPVLNRLLQGRVLRRLRSDLANIPITIGTATIEASELSPAHTILRDLAQLEPKYTTAIETAIKTGDFDHIPLESVSSVRRIVGMAKAHGVAEMVRTALEDDPESKVAIFGLHRDALKAVRALLKPFKPALIYGGTNPVAKDRMINNFHSSYSHRVVVANIAAASTAIDLSCADTAYIFEPSWSPTDNAQAMSRIIKLREPDRAKDVIFVGLANSIDDAVTRICARKAADIEASFREL